MKPMLETIDTSRKIGVKSLETVNFFNGHGPPNAGKGTQLGLICPGISSGDSVRKAIIDSEDRFHTVIAPQAKSMESGGLINDPDISRVALWEMTKLAKQIAKDGVLDIHVEGFPRTLTQAMIQTRFLDYLRSLGITLTEQHLVYPLRHDLVICRSKTRYQKAEEAGKKAMDEGRVPDLLKGEVPRSDDLKIASRLRIYETDTIPAILHIALGIDPRNKAFYERLLTGESRELTKQGVISFINSQSDRAIHFVDPERSIEEVTYLTKQAIGRN